MSSSAIVNYARQFLGTPYVWGGDKPGGGCAAFSVAQGVGLGGVPVAPKFFDSDYLGLRIGKALDLA